MFLIGSVVFFVLFGWLGREEFLLLVLCDVSFVLFWRWIMEEMEWDYVLGFIWELS